MNKQAIITVLTTVFLLGTIEASSQDRFSVTVSIDSAIASVPQKMYMFSIPSVSTPFIALVLCTGRYLMSTSLI